MENVKAINKETVERELRNRMKNVTLEFLLTDLNSEYQNINHGCKGFIRNTENNVVVYIDADDCASQFMYCFVGDTTDYRGFRKRFASSEEELYKNLTWMLQDADTRDAEKRCWWMW